MTEEERFEAWFQEQRRKSWGNGYGHREGQPVPPNWSMGYRALWREGWMARAAYKEPCKHPITNGSIYIDGTSHIVCAACGVVITDTRKRAADQGSAGESK